MIEFALEQKFNEEMKIVGIIPWLKCNRKIKQIA